MTGKQLKNSILQWAIQGKLVPQDPNDEPASVLLERIRAEKALLVKEKKIKKPKNESIIFRGDDNSHYEKFADGTVKCIDDEIPFEIPQSWEWIRLGNVIELLSGRDLEPQKYNSTNKGIPYITGASNFNNGKLVINRWTDEPITVSQKGDLLITCKGTIGAMAFNTIGDIHIARQVMSISSSEISINYIQIFLELYIQKFEAQANSIIPGISREVLLNQLIPIPSQREQHKIVVYVNRLNPYINKYDSSCSQLSLLNSRINDLLKKSILQEAIQGKLVPQDPNDEPAQVLLQRIKAEKESLVKEKKIKRDKQESIIFRGDDNCYCEKLSDGTIENLDTPFDIPDTWEWVRLGDLVYNVSGLSYKKEDLEVKHHSPIRVLRGGNISEGNWCTKDDDIQIAPQFVKPDLLLKAGTFITPAVSSFEQVGKTGLIEEDIPDTVVGGFVLMLIPFIVEFTLLHYLLYLFQTPFYKTICQSIVNKSGQAFYNLSRVKLMNAAIPLPPVAEQQRIVTFLDAIFVHINVK